MSDEAPKTTWRVDPRTGWEIEVRPGESLRSAQARADAHQQTGGDATSPATSGASSGHEVTVVRVAMRQRTAAHARDIERMLNQGWELVEVKSGGLLSGKDLATFRRR